jgi:hypothetical protein
MAMVSAPLQFKKKFFGGGRTVCNGAANMKPKTISDFYKQKK